MKTAFLAATIAVAAAPALAGGYAEPVMEPQVIAEAVGADDSWVVILMTLLVVAAAASN